jgi:hypothetical protein
VIIETITLNSTLTVTLVDQTQHYFGGYYHVKVLAYCDIPLEKSYFADDAEFSHTVETMGVTVRFERVLEKMAVPESEISDVRNALTRCFHETTKKYVSMPDFAHRFVQTEYVKRTKKSAHIRIPRV